MKYLLAPMERLTTPVFRELAFHHKADLTFTEMARLASLARKNKSTLDKITMHSAPTVIQIIGNKESDLTRFLSDYEPPKNFQGINLNLGCPAPEFVRLGLGAAMMRRTSKINSLAKITRDHGYPFSVKLRLGLNNFEKKKRVYLNVINDVHADYFIVHARHGKETYKDKPDYGIFPACARTGKDIIANGSIDSAKKVSVLKDMGVKGVMIGRAAIYDPAIFERLKGLPVTPIEQLRQELLALRKKYGGEDLPIGRRPKDDGIVAG